MNPTTRISAGLSLVALLAVGSTLPEPAQAEFSANFGWVSEYIFRGVPQDDSSAYVGLDYEQDGFYAGTWAADVGQGSEVDLYFGYGGTLADAVDFGIGATGYFYTDDFDDTYREINLSLGREFVSLEAAFGEYDNFAGPTQDYSFIKIAANGESFYALAGTFGQDFDGEYFEVGYATEIAELEVSTAIIHSTSDLLGNSDTAIVFGIGKSFALADLLK